MNKSEYRKNMLLEKIGESGTIIYRVLVITEQALVIDCRKKTMPVWKDYEELDSFTVVEATGNLFGLIPLEDLDAEERRVALQRFNWISEILPFVADTAVRTELIKKVSEEHGISGQTVRNYLCTYLATMNISSLAPKKREFERELTADEKNIRRSLNRWYYNTKKRTLKNCYILMLQHFYCDSTGKLVETYPSYYQFRYFYRKYNKKSTEYISRYGLSYYQRNQRPLVGDGVQAFAPTVGMGMLDSTVCDIYLVNDAGGIVGRPILTLCVDAYSGMVCGYSLAWEGGIYSIRDLLLNVIEDKVNYDSNYTIYIGLAVEPYSHGSGVSGLVKLYNSDGTCLQIWSVSDYEKPIGVEFTYQGVKNETYTITFSGYAYSNNGTAADRLELECTATCN